jgi:hypothetical protein
MEAEDKLRRMGEQMEYEMDEMAEMDAPRGDFSERAMNALVDAHNMVLEVMGAPKADRYPRFEGDVDEFPGRFVRELAMVKDAADEVGATLDMDLSMLEADRDVLLLAGKLEALAKDEQFREAMAREVEEDMADMEDGASLAVAVMTPEDDTDEMFMARA